MHAIHSGAFASKRKQKKQMESTPKLWGHSRICSHTKCSKFISKCYVTRTYNVHCAKHMSHCEICVHCSLELSRIHVNVFKLYAFTALNGHWIQRNLRNYEEWQWEKRNTKPPSASVQNRIVGHKNPRKMRVMTAEIRADCFSRQHRKVPKQNHLQLQHLELFSNEMQMRSVQKEFKWLSFAWLVIRHRRESFHIHYEHLLKH